MLQRLVEEITEETSQTSTTATSAYDCNQASTLSVQNVVDIGSGTGVEVSFEKTNIPADENDPGSGASTTDADWSTVEDATSISADATTWLNLVGPTFRWFRVRVVQTGGTITSVKNYILIRGESKS